MEWVTNGKSLDLRRRSDRLNVGYLLGQPTEPDDRKIETVALLGRATHMQKIIESGLRIEFPESFPDSSQLLQFKYCFRNLDDLKESDFYPELVIVCVKTYSLPKSVL